MANTPAETLVQCLPPERREFTIADASVASGLSFGEAEAGLHALVSEYRGHLRVGEQGDIVFRFPTGFTKPWQTRDALQHAWDRTSKLAKSALRFIVRAWVAIVLVGYVAIFAAIAIGLMFAGRQSNDDRRGNPLAGVLHAIFRLMAEALYWTWHPFSPFYGATMPRMGAPRTRREARPSFYERVDAFFLGPKEQPHDPSEGKRAVLAEIRAGKGRIGLADVMRVTGLPRGETDVLMSKLMLDYDGSVEVSEEGGISYRFTDLRKTVAEGSGPRPPAIWTRPVHAPPVTGNSAGENFVIGGLNGFNLLASTWMIANGMTIERISALLEGARPFELPPPGVPLVLGVIPFLFSLLLFLLPLSRWVLQGRRERNARRANGRRALLRTVLEQGTRGVVSERMLEQNYRSAAGLDIDKRELRREVLELGGDIDQDASEREVKYRFADLELEARAVESEREEARAEEAKIGKVVFSSED